jgi:hypothetical protein
VAPQHDGQFNKVTLEQAELFSVRANKNGPRFGWGDEKLFLWGAFVRTHEDPIGLWFMSTSC